MTRAMTIACVALAGLVGVLGGGPEAWAQAAGPDPCSSGQPCFTNVADILYGRRHLLRTDDLTIAYQIGTGTERASLGSRQLTNNSTVTSNTPSSLSSSDSVSNPIVTGTRLFNTPNDVAVSAVVADGLQWFLDSAAGTIAQGALVPSFGGPRLFAAVADFTGDGYDDLIFFDAEDFSAGDGPTAVVATAVDPETPSQGLRFGGWSNFASGPGNPLAIATATVAGTLRVFSLAHTEDDPTLNCHFLNDLVIASYVVDPQSLGVTSEGTLFPLTIPEGAAACGQFAALASGRFSNTLYDQLAVAYAVQGGTVKVIPIDFDTQGNPVQKPLFDTGQGIGSGRAWIRSGQFEGGNQPPQPTFGRPRHPPMHVDYIVPANKTAAQVLNVSAIPTADLGSPIGSYAKYQKDQGSEVTSSTTTNTSWSFGVGEILETNLTLGDPEVSAVSVDDKFSAQQQWKGSVENANQSITSGGFDVSIATSFGDAIWYDESRLNLYIYPVIGKLVCPATPPNCPDGPKPMTVQFSGIDSYSSTAAAGNTTEWYQ